MHGWVCVLAGWEVGTRRWFSVTLGPAEVPYLFKPGIGAQCASTSAELLASWLALYMFGWLGEAKERKAIEVSLVGVTDNVAIESLTAKRSTTTKWPLMGINMLLSSSLSRARLSLGLRWDLGMKTRKLISSPMRCSMGLTDRYVYKFAGRSWTFKCWRVWCVRGGSLKQLVRRHGSWRNRAPRVRSKKFDKSP